MIEGINPEAINKLLLFKKAANDFGANVFPYNAIENTFICKEDTFIESWYFVFHLNEVLVWDINDFVGQVVYEQNIVNLADVSTE